MPLKTRNFNFSFNFLKVNEVSNLQNRLIYFGIYLKVFKKSSFSSPARSTNKNRKYYFSKIKLLKNGVKIKSFLFKLKSLLHLKTSRRVEEIVISKMFEICSRQLSHFKIEYIIQYMFKLGFKFM